MIDDGHATMLGAKKHAAAKKAKAAKVAAKKAARTFSSWW